MSAGRMWAFDPDADRYDWEHPRDNRPDDDREVPLPFDQVCECGLWKHSDNAVCDDCNDRVGSGDHQ
jgi:hypothetical protein